MSTEDIGIEDLAREWDDDTLREMYLTALAVMDTQETWHSSVNDTHNWALGVYQAEFKRRGIEIES